jgi:hypothetical protein
MCIIQLIITDFFRTQDGTKGVEEMDGRGRCPYDPLHNSTSIYTGDQLYSGTVADFSGSDPLIYKEPMRTERLDFKQLNGMHTTSHTIYTIYIHVKQLYNCDIFDNLYRSEFREFVGIQGLHIFLLQRNRR